MLLRDLQFKVFFCLFTIALIISFSNRFPSTVKASDVLFSDNFDDGNANGWIIAGDSGWNVQNGEYGIYFDSGLSNTLPDDTYWNNSWDNYSFEVDLRGVSGTDKNLVFRFIDNSNFYSVHHSLGNIYFSKYIEGQQYMFAEPLPYPLENGTVYHFRLEVEGDHFRLFESNNLLFDVIDENEPKILAGKIGLRVGTGSVGPTEVWFDNVVVNSLTTELPSLNVPDLKQYSAPWNDDLYDHANIWSSNPTIQRWGCALTSISMVLKYHGHLSTNPDTLNEWLKSQSDGYLRNGLLNWLAISRYTTIDNSPSSPVLLYRKLLPDRAILINELTQRRPVILKVLEHYVVSKSQLTDTFGINDPAYANRPTLKSYGNSFSSIGSYKPTNTDLSYILLAINSGASLKVFDPDNNELESYFYTDKPSMDNPQGTQIGGESLGIFLFPTPAHGNYKLEVSGPNNRYTLDAYLYDKGGNVTQSSLDGLISKAQKDEFTIFIGETSGIKQEITIDSIIQDLDTSWNYRLIKNNGFYRALRFELTTVKKLLFIRQNKSAKKFLIGVFRQIKSATPFLIDSKTSQILQKNIQILIDSL